MLRSSSVCYNLAVYSAVSCMTALYVIILSYAYLLLDASFEFIHNTSNYFYIHNSQLSVQILSEIFKSGYSRIPVYGVNKNDIVGLILTKDLIFLDPDVRTCRDLVLLSSYISLCMDLSSYLLVPLLVTIQLYILRLI